MNLLTSFGNILGSMPVASGRTYWVSPGATTTVNGRVVTASDGNDGYTPYRPLRTINRAWALVGASQGDVIVLLPGTHTPQNSAGTATSVAASVAGVTMTGLPFLGSGRANTRMPLQGLKRRTIISATLLDELVNITAADIELSYLHFTVTPGADPSQQAVDISAAGTRTHIHDCTFSWTTTNQASDTAVMAVEIIGAADQVVLDHCHFYVKNNMGPALRITAAATNTLVESSTFEWGSSGTALDDWIEVTAAAIGLTFRDLDFISNQTANIAECIDIAGATTDESTSVIRCVFPVGSDPVAPAAAADVSFASNILAQVSGGTGGTAVVD
jgi:hypothetical protein